MQVTQAPPDHFGYTCTMEVVQGVVLPTRVLRSGYVVGSMLHRVLRLPALWGVHLPTIGCDLWLCVVSFRCCDGLTRGVGTGPAGRAAAGPIFRQKKIGSTERGLCQRLLVLTQSQT